MISCESVCATTFFALDARHIHNPNNRASYSALLLVAEKLNRTACSILPPLGEIMSNPAPEQRRVEDPSTYNFHASSEGTYSIDPVISVMKSARACALMPVLDSYSIP